MKGYKRPNWQESSANEQHLQTTLFRQVFSTRSYESRQAMLPDVLRVNANLFQSALYRTR